MRFKTFSNRATLLCLFFAAAVSIVSDSLNVIALYIAIPSAFLLSYVRCGKLFHNKYLMIQFALYAWYWFSSLWAAYPVSANRELHRILGAVLMTYIMGVWSGQENAEVFICRIYRALFGRMGLCA